MIDLRVKINSEGKSYKF